MTDAAAQSIVTVTRRRPLKTVRDCARQLAVLYWEMREGKVEPALGGRLAFTLMGLSRVIETAELEGRLVALEEGHAEATD